MATAIGTRLHRLAPSVRAIAPKDVVCVAAVLPCRVRARDNDAMATSYTVERTATTTAPPGRVHGLVADFHAWRAWSPWEDIDPGMTRTYEGPDSGVGARYAWSGNRKAGAGSMEITGDDPERVDVDLRFTRPFPSESRMQLLITPTGDTTVLTWRLLGEVSGVARLFTMVRPMDSVVGPDFERGLQRLTRVAESG